MRPALIQLLRLAVFAYTFLIACPIRYHFASAGLDASWAWALNYGAEHGFVHGRDLAFTYGPWAWVALPMGAMLGPGLAWQAVIWASFGVIFAYLLWVRKIGPLNAILIAVCVFAGARLFVDFGYAGPDFFLTFVAMLALAAAIDASESGNKEWILLLGVAIALSGPLFLIKLTAGIQIASAIAALPVGLWFFDRKQALLAAAGAAVGIPLALVTSFFLHYPSFSALAQYVRGAYDIASGFSVTMSATGERPVDLQLAMLLLASFAALCAALFALRKRAAVMALCILGPLFLSFKHAFVRPVGHIDILFFTAPLLLAAVIATTRFKGKRWWAALIPIALVTGSWLARESFLIGRAELERRQFGLSTLTSAREAMHLDTLRSRLDTFSRTALAPDVISGIPRAATAVIPSETAYVAANKLPFRSFPVFQTYQAYTANLDAMNARRLDDPAAAPEQILFHWGTLDGRHPVLDAPSLMLGVLRHYDYVSSPGGLLLLRRRAASRFAELRKTRSATMRVGEPLAIDTARPQIARLHLKLNMRGQLFKLFYKLPQLEILLTSKRGRVISARVAPDVLAGDVAVNFTPDSIDHLRDLFTNDTAWDPFSELLITGDAAPYYEPAAETEFLEIDGWNLKLADSPLNDLSKLTNQGEARAAKIEVINDTGVTSLAANEIAAVACPKGYALITGWAFDYAANKPASAVYLRIDGELYKVDYGQIRMDNVALFRNRELAPTGFAAVIPPSRLGAGAHRMQLVVVTADGSSYGVTSQSVQFRRQP